MLRSGDRLDWVGTVSGIAPEADALAEALAVRKDMDRGGEFVGRLSTSVYASETLVVKVRAEYAFARADAERWIGARIERERELGIYPDGKSWYLIAAGAQFVAVNAAPRLRSLQHWAAADTAQLHEVWSGLADLYLDARERGYRLDEDLSNFGVDAAGQVRYLDDDLYPWRGFGALAAFLDRTFCRRDVAGAAVVACAIAGRFVARLGPAGSAGLLHEMEAIAPLGDTHAQRLTTFVDGLRPIRRPSRSRPEHAGPLGLLADVHANLPALRAAVSALEAQGIRRFLVLGDSVGYGPFPGECIDVLSQLDAVVIRGNHDEAVASDVLPTPFSRDARWVIEWTRDRLSARQRAWLGALPLRYEADDWMAVHGAPGDPEHFRAYVYQMTSAEQLDCLQALGHRLCFHGHSHLAGAYLRGRHGDRFCEAAPIALSDVRHALICPGSVGQPRGGGKGCQYGVFDPAGGQIRLSSVGYATDAVVEAMRRHDFPHRLTGHMAQV